MKQLIIRLPKDSIFTEVSLASSYAGVKSCAEDSDYSRIATVTEDSELLERFWTDACGEVASVLKEFTVDTVFTEEGFELNLELSSAYESAMTPSVERDLFSSVAAGVTARWFRFTLPDKAEEWEIRSDELLTRAHRKLCSRRKPIRVK